MNQAKVVQGYKSSINLPAESEPTVSEIDITENEFMCNEQVMDTENVEEITFATSEKTQQKYPDLHQGSVKATPTKVLIKINSIPNLPAMMMKKKQRAVVLTSSENTQKRKTTENNKKEAVMKKLKKCEKTVPKVSKKIKSKKRN